MSGLWRVSARTVTDSSPLDMDLELTHASEHGESHTLGFSSPASAASVGFHTLVLTVNPRDSSGISMASKFRQIRRCLKVTTGALDMRMSLRVAFSMRGLQGATSLTSSSPRTPLIHIPLKISLSHIMYFSLDAKCSLSNKLVRLQQSLLIFREVVTQQTYSYRMLWNRRSSSMNLLLNFKDRTHGLQVAGGVYDIMLIGGGSLHSEGIVWNIGQVELEAELAAKNEATEAVAAP